MIVATVLVALACAAGDEEVSSMLGFKIANPAASLDVASPAWGWGW